MKDLNDLDHKTLLVNKDYEKAKAKGLTQIEHREIAHHPMSIRLLNFMAIHDFLDYDDYMCIKSGGEGDNGEHLMHLMDPFFELLEQERQ